MKFSSVPLAFMTCAILMLNGCSGDFTAGPQDVDGISIYVSPTGTDSAAGTFDAPVATLRRARDMIRSLKAAGPQTMPITVFLRGGVYHLSETLNLDGQDSGTPEALIRYQSYPNERAIISGGAPIVGPWREWSDHIYVTNVGARRFNSLFVDGERAVRAREPDENEIFPYYRIVRREECLYEKTVWPDECWDRFHFHAGEITSNWGLLQDIEVVQLARWSQPRFRLDHVDDPGQLAFVVRDIGVGFNFGFDYNGTDRYYVENFLEGLDTPGEWYLDKTNGDLYYWPLTDKPIAQSEFIAPTLGQLLQIGDFPAVNTLSRGFYGSYNEPSLGFEQSDFSISLWLSFPQGSVNPAWPLSKGDSYFKSGWGIAAWSDGEDPIPSVDLFLNDGSGPLYLATGSQVRGQWAHYVWTIDRAANVVTAYKNGVFAGQLALPPAFGSIAADFPLEIGRYAGTALFMGAMDELRLFSRVLAPAEVVSLFEENIYSGAPPILEHTFDGNLANTAPGGVEGIWYVQSTFTDSPFGQGLEFAPRGSEPLTSHPGFVHDLAFADLGFEHTDWSLAAKGFGGSILNYELDESPAALAVAGSDVTIEDCTIGHIGADAVRLLGQRIAVLNTEISDVGASGVVLGSPRATDYTYRLVASLAFSNRVEDNLIHSFGRVFREAAGITQFLGSGNLIAHNRVWNGPYSGITAGWWSQDGWGSIAGDNTIEFNEIFDVMRSLNDGGGIYVNGTQPGTVISNNVLHDIVATSEHPQDIEPVGTFIWGIYLDGTSAQMLVQGNLIYRTAWGGIMLNAAENGNRDNVVMNNILADGISYQTFLNHASADRFERNIIYFAGSAPLFWANSDDAIGVSDYNLFYSARSADLGPEWNQWRSYGFDANSIVADPGFTNYNADDFTVPADSPAVTELGFVMPDFTEVGPRGEQ